MSCLFGCFGATDDRRRPSAHLVSDQPPPNSTEAVVVRNRKRLGLLLSQEKEGSLGEEKGYNNVGDTKERDGEFRALKDEAKFLKGCGTLPETPAEIREASKLVAADSPFSGDSNSMKFHSWLPNTSMQKLNLEDQAEQPPIIKLFDGWITGSGSSGHTPSSCITGDQIPARISTSSTEDSNFGIGTRTRTNQNTSMQFRNKSVQFDHQSDVSTSSSEVYCQSSKRSESVGNDSVSKPSPYPTPLQLSDDMQTPGTVFPSYARNIGDGKNPRIRSQYVYSVSNPVNNLSQWDVLKEEDCKLSSHLTESLEQTDKEIPNSDVSKMEDSFKDESKVDASLSSWFKPINKNGNNQRAVSFSGANTYFGKTLGDRPIIGMVAAHWTEEEPSRISPKRWDGNGVPNSTTKYKEDQKVSWHATPFEERLEKALSEESCISHGKKNLSETPPINFNESEECDTALSQLKSSTHFRSVVSC